MQFIQTLFYGQKIRADTIHLGLGNMSNNACEAP
jgi:hypothetical protein